MSRNITCIALDLTTVCDRACQDCCCNINTGERPAAHHDWAYFERAAQHICGVERVHVTGGEPTTHPHFAEFVPRFKSLFDCQTLTLQTDGFKAQHYADTLKHFNHVYVSRYDERNARAADFVRINYPSTEWSGAFTPRAHRGSGKPCARGFSETVAYADGRLFGCCVAPGIPGAASLEPCADWRDKIEAVPLPCGDCWFSPVEAS
jgi:hypothetical protein